MTTTYDLAIIGSGPSGFYAADTFAKKLPDCHIDIIDKLPTPYGLVRAGVAPDHQGTKNVTRQFERTMQNDKIRFLGNVEVGRDVKYSDLKNPDKFLEIFDGLWDNFYFGETKNET